MEEQRKSIDEIDKNFAVEQVVYEGMKTYRLPCSPFEINGFYRTGTGAYTRLPKEVSDRCCEPVQQMVRCTSGGRIRFRTDSERIILKYSSPDPMTPMPHMAFTGSNCFDLYADSTYVNAFRPGMTVTGEHLSRTVYFAAHGYEALMRLPGRKMREILIHFPLYARVDDVWIALEENASVEMPTPYEITTPIVFYGTSVTQGGCVSHAGNNYPALLSSWLSADFLNLGFSDGGRGDQAMAEYLTTLPMSVLVLNFDGNVRIPDIKDIYEPFFRTVRSARPALPVVFASEMFSPYQDHGADIRRETVRETYEHAVSSGDRKVWLIDGKEAIAPYGGTDTASVEGRHANDLGSWAYAKALEPVLREALASGIRDGQR